MTLYRSRNSECSLSWRKFYDDKWIKFHLFRRAQFSLCYGIVSRSQFFWSSFYVWRILFVHVHIKLNKDRVRRPQAGGGKGRKWFYLEICVFFFFSSLFLLLLFEEMIWMANVCEYINHSIQNTEWNAKAFWTKRNKTQRNESMIVGQIKEEFFFHENNEMNNFEQEIARKCTI